MSRKNYTKKEINSDPIYSRKDIAKFINYLMEDGKKSVAEKVFYKAIEVAGKKAKGDPIKVFETALENTSPVMELVSRRIGGANYQIPREVRPERKFYLSAKWIIDAAYKKKGAPMHERLAEEIVAAYNKEGAAMKKKQDTHRMAEANRAFASLIRK